MRRRMSPVRQRVPGMPMGASALREYAASPPRLYWLAALRLVVLAADPAFALGGIPVSDLGTFRGLTQFVTQFANPAADGVRKLLILNGEMAERLKAHAWKAKRASDTDPLRSVSTHTRSAT